MALRAVPDHPKFAHLKSLLKLPKAVVLGYLECMWHFTGRFTPQGNIGKYSDLAIESWLEWDGEEGKLIDVLIKSGWLDIDEAHRLIVHDWHQHADKASRQALGRAGLKFVVPEGGTVCVHRGHTETKTENTVDTPGTLPVPVPVPVPETKAKATPRKSVSFVPPDWVPLESWAAFVEMRKKIRAPLTYRACELTVIELQKLAKLGHDPGACLDQSVERSWRGVFEINRGNGNGANQRSSTRPFDPGIYTGPWPEWTDEQVEEMRKKIAATKAKAADRDAAATPG